MKQKQIDQSYFLQSNPRLFEETLREFASKGYESASLNEILKRSAFNKGSFYYRFAEKLDLFVALLDTLFARHRAELEADRTTLYETSGIRMSLAVMVASLYRLHAIDPRYLDLYQRIDDERTTQSAAIGSALDASPIEKHLSDARTVLLASGMEADPVSLFEKIARVALYRIGSIAMTDHGWIPAADVAAALWNAAFPDRPDTSSTHPMFFRILPSADAKDVEIEIAHGEILAFVGPADASAAVLRRLPVLRDRAPMQPLRPSSWKRLIGIVAKETDSPPGIRSDRTVRWHFRRLDQATVTADDDPIAELGLSDVADTRLDRLPESFIRLIATGVAFLPKSDPVVVADPFGGTDEAQRRRICQMLLKRKSIGITILLSVTNVSEVWAVADRIAFVGQNGIVKTVAADELRRRYGEKAVVVRYLDSGLSRLARFPLSAIGGTEFGRFLIGKNVVSIDTESLGDADIYRIETGEDLS